MDKTNSGISNIVPTWMNSRLDILRHSTMTSWETPQARQMEVSASHVSGQISSRRLRRRSPEAPRFVTFLFREIISFYGPRIQVSEI
jgi:hypothetical protein